MRSEVELKVFCRMTLTLGLGCWLMLAACNGPIYVPDQRVFSDALTPRNRWVATSDFRDAFRAIDDNINTAAVSDPAYQNAMLTIDLGKACLFNMVVVEHGPDEWGFCRKLAILISNDGRNFRQEAVVPGLRRVTTAVLVRRVLARYVRLQVVEPGQRPWSVAEVHLN